MKRTMFLCLTLIMLLGITLTGCSKETVFLDNQVGTVGVDEEAVELQDGTFMLYINDNPEGVFTFAQTDTGWTIFTMAEQYIALNEEDGSVITGEEPFAWTFDGAFSAAFGESTVYLGNGLTASADKPTTDIARPTGPDSAYYRYVMLDKEGEPTPEPTSDPTQEPTPEPAEGMVASVEMNDTTTYYTTFGEAWSAANAADGSTFVVVNLLDDVTAVDGRFGDYGALTTVNRTGWIVLNLGGHTLSRGLTSATDNGEVFRLDASGYMTIKNGTITGGNSKDNGGCFYIGGVTELVLESLTVTGNHSDENGSALYLAADDAKVTLDNVTVTGNTADDSGAVFWAIDGIRRSTLVFENKVEISGNSGDGGLNNLVYDGHGWSCKLNTDSMGTDSKIGVSYFDGYGGPLADSFGSRLEELRSCFFADQGNHDITSGDGTLVVKFKNDVAAAIHDGEWTLYSTFAQAWASADGYQQGTDATMILFGDWVASKFVHGFDDDGGYGEDCYFFDEHALHPRERKNHSWLILDLNGHTISGNNHFRILYLDEGIRMKIKNGTLKSGRAFYAGAYVATEGKGAAIYVNDGDIQLDLENLAITDCIGENTGSALYVEKAESINFNTVTIERNSYLKADHYDAIKNPCAVYLDDCDIRMYGKMLIRNNTDETNWRNKQAGNLALCDYIDDMGDIRSDMAGSEIHLTVVTNYYSSRGFAGIDQGHRDITEDYATVRANADMFKIDTQLGNKGYKWVAAAEEKDGKATLAIYDYNPLYN